MKQYNFGADFLHQEFKQFAYGYRGSLSSRVGEATIGFESHPLCRFPSLSSRFIDGWSCF
jgi:hypothetical protein